MTVTRKQKLPTKGKQVENKPKRVIYVGPSLSKGRLLHGQIFIGGLFPVVEETIKTYPWFKNLLVAVEDYTEKVRETKTMGTPLHLYYERAKEV